MVIARGTDVPRDDDGSTECLPKTIDDERREHASCDRPSEKTKAAPAGGPSDARFGSARADLSAYPVIPVRRHDAPRTVPAVPDMTLLLVRCRRLATPSVAHDTSCRRRRSIGDVTYAGPRRCVGSATDGDAVDRPASAVPAHAPPAAAAERSGDGGSRRWRRRCAAGSAPTHRTPRSPCRSARSPAG